MNKRMVVMVALLLCGTLMLGACTTDPNTGARKPSKTGWGAMIGAAGGALAGVIVGGGRKGAIIGAGIGALAGTAIGHYMDQQEKQLKQATNGTGVEVQRTGDQIVLEMPGEVSFDVDSSRIKPNFEPVLDRVAKIIAENPKTYVDVQGHTDSTGSDAHNQKLSEDRAQAVSMALERRGVHSSRLVTKGFGKTKPVASNDTAEGRSRNRRVEIVLTPLT